VLGLVARQLHRLVTRVERGSEKPGGHRWGLYGCRVWSAGCRVL
jgi:hypothetical protein